MANIFNSVGNYFSNAFSSWDNYHKYGIIPNLWAGITGQKSSEMQSSANIAESQRQFDNNLDFLSQQFQDELSFQREQYKGQMAVAKSNLLLNKDVANRNLDLQQQAFDYQKQLNATQMEREDSAIQRQIADLQAAGMSPLAAIGGSGSSSTPLSSGSAPQMDISGINNAVGQYVDIARQYASLHAQATQNYMNGRNQAAVAHNSQVLGARTALNQMKADMHFKGQNMATQYFNAAVNASNARLQRDYMREQIKTKKYENNWYDEHGYQLKSMATVLSDFLNGEGVKNIGAKLGGYLQSGLIILGNAVDKLATNVVGNHNGNVRVFSNEDVADIMSGLNNSEQNFVNAWAKEHHKQVNEMTLNDWLQCSNDYSKYR